MSQAKITETFNAPVKTVYKVLTDYSSYPHIMTDIKRVSVIDDSPEKKLVEFELQIIKSFRYQLWLYEKPFSQLSWKFHSGDVFKENTGSWTLKDEGENRTHVTYEISAKFGLFVPGMIEKKLIEVNLPSMMNAYKKRAEEL